MPYLLAILIPLGLLALFLALVAFEGRTGRRLVLPGRRELLDLKAARLAFVVRHVDWGAFANDVTRTGLERLAHDLAHSTLIGVRALERELTGLVRTLRARRDAPLLPARAADRPSRLESAVAYLKKSVQRSRTLPGRTQEGERVE